MFVYIRTMETASKPAALDAALAQIDAHFGKGPDTPARRMIRARYRLRQLTSALDGARKAVEAEKQREKGECPTIAIDPFAAYAVGWHLRQQADADEAVAVDGVPEALEEAAGEVESAEVFGSAEDMLADLIAEIDYQSYVAEHGEDPKAPPYIAEPQISGEGLPF